MVKKLSSVVLALALVSCWGGKPQPSPSPTPTVTPVPTPPPTTQPSPTPAPRMLLVGYYYGSYHRYGDFWKSYKGYTNLFLDWELGAPSAPEYTQRAVQAGKKLWVSLGMYAGYDNADYVRKSLQALKPFWNSVVVVELGDELQWNGRTVVAKANLVRQEMDALNLPRKPLGITFTNQQIFQGTSWQQGLDWVGLEAYLDYLTGEKPRDAATRMTQHINKLLKRVGNRKVVLVGQSYSRNFNWLDMDSLLAIQEPIFAAAKRLHDSDQLLALTLFAYGRPSGVVSHKFLQHEHELLVQKYTK